MIKDPRGPKRQTKFTNGKNTESFDPKSTFCRPDMRILCKSKSEQLTHMYNDDVVLIPKFVSDFYYDLLLQELYECQQSNVKDSEYISWHEGCHLIVKNPKESKTFNKIVKEICEYFDINEDTASYRFNLYKDDKDWKSLHHDSAAFNKQRAKTQNVTVGLSLGATRELVFKHAKNNTLLYFPQENGTIFCFGKAVNIRFLHGINAVPECKQTNDGRISIIVWGFSRKPIDEPNDPDILEDNDRRKIDKICRDFQRGNCRWNDKCKFIHSNY